MTDLNYSKIRKWVKSRKFQEEIPRHWKYACFYPEIPKEFRISMNEGFTPLLGHSKIKNVFFKFEGVNPTGSFKDRGSTIEISTAIQHRFKEVVCATTGNMGASISAYAARAGIKARIFIPDFVPKHKFEQIRSHGAKIVKVRGDYDAAVKACWEDYEKREVMITGDYPLRAEGQQSVAFEVLDQLRWNAPDYVVCPVGNGTLLFSTYMALWRMKEVGLISRIPKLIGVQARACNPLQSAAKNKMEFIPIENPRTVANAINCGNPVFGAEVLNAIHQTNGKIVSVSDAEMIAAKAELGKEGIYAEVSAASGYAAIKKIKLTGKIVCLVTGHGLKDDIPPTK